MLSFILIHWRAVCQPILSSTRAEYALGSARESRDWYYKGRHILGEAVLHHRLALLSEVIRLLLTMVPQQRGSVLREPPITYQTGSDTSLSDSLTNDAHLSALLHTIPY